MKYSKAHPVYGSYFCLKAQMITCIRVKITIITRLMLKTNALHRDNHPENLYPKISKSEKWVNLLSPIWHSRYKYDGKGVVFISSDANALLERLDLLLANKKASHTNVGNELVSICDELKRQGVLDTRSYCYDPGVTRK